MSILNSVLRAAFDLLLLPFRGLPPIVGLAVVSLLVAVLMLLIFKHTSNQRRIADVKRHIHAGLFEMRLFNDDPRAIFRAMGEIGWHNLRYIGLSLVPLVVMLPPVVLVMAQLQFHYGYDPLPPGRSTLVTVELARRWEGPGRPALSLEAPDGVRVETAGIWAPAELREGKAAVSTMTWRMAAERPGDHALTVRLDGQAFTKSFNVERGVARRSPVRHGTGFLDQLLYPAEPALPEGSPLRGIRVSLPEAEVNLLGWETHWLIHFFILSLVFAFALRNKLGVTI